MYKSPLPKQKNLICMVHLLLLPLQALVPTVDEVSSMFSRSEGFMMLSGHFPKVGGTVSGTNNKEMESIVPCPHLQVISEDGMLVKVSVTLWHSAQTSLLYNSSSLVSVAYSALGDSTMASTGQLSWQKPQ